MCSKRAIVLFLLIINSVAGQASVRRLSHSSPISVVTAAGGSPVLAGEQDPVDVASLLTGSDPDENSSLIRVADTVAPRLAAPRDATDEITFIGTVIRISANIWEIDGIPVVVKPGTRLVNDPALGDRVQVTATRDRRGTFALEIETVF